jgi:hypothetical protein
MSLSFSLAGITEFNFIDITKKTGVNNLLLVEDSLIQQDGLFPEGYGHIIIDNISVRPVELEYDGNLLSIRILSGSSPTDYNLAAKLAYTVAAQYKTDISVEDDGDISYQDFQRKYNESWGKNQSRQMLEMIFEMCRAGKESLQISTQRGDFTIGPNFLTQIEGSDSIYDEFEERVGIFNYSENKGIFTTSLIVLHNDLETIKVKVATFGESVPTLVSVNADIIGLCSNGGEKIMIATSKLLELLKDNITWIGEDLLYLKAYSGSEWKKLFKKAKNYELEDYFSEGSEITDDDLNDNENLQQPILSFSEIFTEDEWKKLIYTPFLAFILIALADGSIDKKEINVFIKSMTEHENPLLEELLNSCDEPPEEIFNHLISLGEEVPVLLQEINEILNSKLPDNYAIAFKFEIYQMAKKVAEASGGFLGFGKKISAEEEKILVAIATLFGLIE